MKKILIFISSIILAIGLSRCFFDEKKPPKRATISQSGGAASVMVGAGIGYGIGSINDETNEMKAIIHSQNIEEIK